MKSRPTWTRYGNAIVMMKRATTQYRREGEQADPGLDTPWSPIYSDLPPEPGSDEGDSELIKRPLLVVRAGRFPRASAIFRHGRQQAPN